MDLAEYEQLNPRCEIDRDGTTVVYATPNRATKWRVETLYTKEPVTIEWLGRLGPDDVLADIGANVGMYAIWAAKLRGARVYAFEPESQNYALLNRNIHDNGLADRVFAFCVALSDVTSFHRLYLSQFIPGGSCHNFGEPVDYRGQALKSPFVQGAFSTTVDALVAQGAMPVPTHVKIDVDGIEPKVMAGAKATLMDKRVRSLLIEINTNLEAHWDIIDWMLEAGFDYDLRQADAGRREKGAFEGVGNYVFRR